jgi:hypothetical protein
VDTKHPKAKSAAKSDRKADLLLSELLHNGPTSKASYAGTAKDETSETLQEQKSTPEELKFEYDQLRKEIMQNDLLTVQVMAGIIILTGALMGFASNQTVDPLLKAFLFFFLEITALIGLMQNTDRMRSTYAIGSYLKIFIEAKTENVKWETRIAKFRSKRPKHGRIQFFIHQRLMYTIIIFTNYIFGGYFFLKSNTFLFVTSFRILLLGLFITVLLLFIQSRNHALLGREHTKLYDDIWREIRDEENGKEG